MKMDVDTLSCSNLAFCFQSYICMNMLGNYIPYHLHINLHH